ncbi:Gfo/Idh/MocA family oxidoreductase [Leptospira sp. 96542]|nr:Gfo/Idh/MocA family oxidoreductase [Leptospira sp. 96542]
MKIKTFLIGLGQIGMGYDFKENYSSFCLTHLNAILAHDNFDLIGGFDISIENRNRFESKTSIESFSDLIVGLEKSSPEFVIIATPTKTHFEILKSVVNIKTVKAILCEKPISHDLSEASEMINLCDQNQIKLFVNYQRYYLPSSEKIKTKLSPLGIPLSFLKGVCWYSKGLLHNGSHFINLLEYWLGDLLEISIIETHNYWSEEDFEPDALMKFQNGNIFFLSSRESDFSNYSIELVTSDGKLTYKNGGAEINWQSKIQDSVYKDYTTLSLNIEDIVSESNMSQYFVLDQIRKYLLTNDNSRVCEAITTLNMMKLLQKLKDTK